MTRDDPATMSKARAAFRALYFAYEVLVYIPYLAISTLLLGILAVGIAMFSPRLAFHCGTVWSWLLCRLNFMKVTVLGREHADPEASYIIMSNHQSHFDVLAFYGHWGRQFRWVIKEELRRIPGLGWYCQAGGHVFVDRSSRERAIESLRAARPLLKDGVSVMLFPEGTRSRDGRLQEFKKGGFMMALDLGLPILPVSITGTRHVAPSGSIRMLPGRVQIQVHPPVDPADYGVERRDELMARVREVIESGIGVVESSAP